MENFRKYVPWALRIIVAFLFIISAVAKLYPSPYFAISTFEVKQLYPMGFSEDMAAYFSRILIGIEFALGLLLLQPHYLKRLVIPATSLLLIVFIVHLAITTFSGGNSGNCGCFGELLPMTPVEAIIKNIIALAMLIWLYILLPKEFDRRNFWVLTTVTFASILMIFMLAPMQNRTQQPFEIVDELPVENEPGIVDQPTDTTGTPAEATTVPAVNTPAAEAPKAAVNEPAQKKSAYTQYFANVNKGKHIVALFVPGCDHCRDAAKDLIAMKAKDKNFPPVSVIFMDEEADKIPDFFAYAGGKFPYKVIDIISFWNLLGNDKDTPGVIYLWNGNKMKEWDGINDKAFKIGELVRAVNQPYSGK
jgi:hypothetical protein